MAKTVINEPGASKQVSEQGAKIIKAIEEQCEQDKTMANLKSKVNEIKHIISKAWLQKIRRLNSLIFYMHP